MEYQNGRNINAIYLSCKKNILAKVSQRLEQKEAKCHSYKAIKGIQICYNQSKYCIQVTTDFKVTKTKNPVSRVILIIKSSGGVVALNALADASM